MKIKFLIPLQIDGKTYVGQGLSKPLARQNAAENALKCLLLEKMTTATGKAQVDVESDGQSNQVDSSQSVAVNIESLENAIRPSETVIEEQDEVPWSSLASFALYKLFLEWQNQGTVVPVPRPGVSPGRGKKEPKVPVEKDLPLNAMDIHPVMLLNQMKPGLTYVEVNRVGNPPNTLFTLAVEIDGINYNGSGKKRKLPDILISLLFILVLVFLFSFSQVPNEYFSLQLRIKKMRRKWQLRLL